MLCGKVPGQLSGDLFSVCPASSRETDLVKNTVVVMLYGKIPSGPRTYLVGAKQAAENLI